MKLRLIALLSASFLATLSLAARLPRTVLPQHYDLTVTPDLAGERFSGELVISAGVQQPVTEIQLNSAEITFRSASVESGGQTQRATITTDARNETVTLRLASPLAVGPATIRIGYDGILNRQLRGFYIGESGGKKYLASQMEALDARRAFPSFDEPDLKATYRITVIADSGLNVISNAAVESETPGPIAGKRTVRFGLTPRLSTYHIALVVGDFACIGDTVEEIPLRICAAPDKVEMGRVALEATKDLVRFFNQYFDIDYPFGKLDQIAIPDFGAGAMENPGAIIYRERVLLADPRTASPEALRGGISTISHEIAHIWFGDMVTMRWWDDLWLNEGFASWLGRKGLESVRPDWKRVTSDVNAAANPMRSDMLLATRPIHKAAETADEIDQLFDGIAYGKTAALLRMLESWMGEEKFRDGNNLYMSRHAFSNASSGEFVAAMQDVGGGDVAAVLASYVNQPGVPLITVTSRCEAGKTVVDLQQMRFLVRDERNPEVDAQLWTVPVCFAGDGCVTLRERKQTFRLDGCRNPLVANANGRGYYLTAYSPEALRQLVAGKDLLNPAERVALVRDQWLLVRAGRASIGDFLDLADAFRSDRNAASELLASVPAIERFLVDASQRSVLQRWLRTWSGPLLLDLGWTPRATESPDDRQLRSMLLTTLGEHAGDAPTLKQARQLTDQWLKKREGVDPSLVADVTSLAARNGDARLYDTYLRGYRSASDPREKSRFLGLLSDFRDPRLIRRTLDLSLTDDVRSQDMASVLSQVIANPSGTDAGWKFVKENWAAIDKKMVPGHIGRVISAMGSATCDRAAIDEVKEFAESHKLTQARQATGLALERIAACVDLRAAQHDRLAQWLAARTPATK